MVLPSVKELKGLDSKQEERIWGRWGGLKLLALVGKGSGAGWKRWWRVEMLAWVGNGSGVAGKGNGKGSGCREGEGGILIIHVPVRFRKFSIHDSTRFARKGNKGVDLLACLCNTYETSEDELRKTMEMANSLIAEILKKKPVSAYVYGKSVEYERNYHETNLVKEVMGRHQDLKRREEVADRSHGGETLHRHGGYHKYEAWDRKEDEGYGEEWRNWRHGHGD
ncbi:hypothetical protein DVH24_035770 [Malus domestica]|uniref:Uncharacterized protein n=1 Tax=Malus domestica TaxID=3750 RepID=A0A498JU87_MALDO|nr:hypothetical protein DVH24_035770 [Malus domestica]